MKGTRRLPIIGTDIPAWAQEFMTAVKTMLTAPAYPQTDKVLLYNHSTGITDWVSISSSLTVTDGQNSTISVPVNPPPFDDMEEDYPVGAVALTMGQNPNTLYAVGVWSALTGTTVAMDNVKILGNVDANAYKAKAVSGISFSGTIGVNSVLTIASGIIVGIT